MRVAFKSLMQCVPPLLLKWGEAYDGDGTRFFRVWFSKIERSLTCNRVRQKRTVGLGCSFAFAVAVVSYGASVSAAGSNPDDVWDVTSTYDYFKKSEKLAGNYSNPHRQSGHAYIFNSAGQSGAPIDKPIIVVQPYVTSMEISSGETDVERFYRRMNTEGRNFIENARAEGFDFIFLDLDSDSGSIPPNAMLLATLIDRVNKVKTTSGSNLVIIGPSMGGVIARYALTYMEKAGIDHQARLFLSYDAPYVGANVPVSLQFLVSDMNDLYNLSGKTNVAAKQANAEFLTEAFKELVLYPFYGANGSDGRNMRADLLLELAEMGGHPKKTRNVGIANGAGDGLPQRKTDMSSGSIWPVGTDRMSRYSKLLQWNYTLDSNCSIEINTFSYYYNKQLYERKPTCVFSGFVTVLLPMAGSYTATSSSSTDFDFSPGGVSAMPFQIMDAMGNLGTTTITTATTSFVPTVSALDMSNTSAYYDLASDSNVLSRTWFDRVVTGSTAYPEAHLEIRQANKDAMLSEMRNYNYKYKLDWLPAVMGILLD